MLEEVERSLDDALKVVAVAVEDGVVYGGGATESDLAVKLRDEAAKVGGREQLAVEAFAQALEAIPWTLAENAGLDPIDMLIELRKSHKSGKQARRRQRPPGKVDDMGELHVVEPIRVGRQAIQSATDAAVMVLRIDDVIASKSSPLPPAAARWRRHGRHGRYGWHGRNGRRRLRRGLDAQRSRRTEPLLPLPRRRLGGGVALWNSARRSSGRGRAWRAHGGRSGPSPTEEISAKVRSEPSGKKIGSYPNPPAPRVGRRSCRRDLPDCEERRPPLPESGDRPKRGAAGPDREQPQDPVQSDGVVDKSGVDVREPLRVLQEQPRILHHDASPGFRRGGQLRFHDLLKAVALGPWARSDDSTPRGSRTHEDAANFRDLARVRRHERDAHGHQANSL